MAPSQSAVNPSWSLSDTHDPGKQPAAWAVPETEGRGEHDKASVRRAFPPNRKVGQRQHQVCMLPHVHDHHSQDTTLSQNCGLLCKLSISQSGRKLSRAPGASLHSSLRTGAHAWRHGTGRANTQWAVCSSNAICISGAHLEIGVEFTPLRLRAFRGIVQRRETSRCEQRHRMHIHDNQDRAQTVLTDVLVHWHCSFSWQADSVTLAKHLL